MRSSLIGDYVAHGAGTGPHAKDVDGPYHTLAFAFVLHRIDDARARADPA